MPNAVMYYLDMVEAEGSDSSDSDGIWEADEEDESSGGSSSEYEGDELELRGEGGGFGGQVRALERGGGSGGGRSGGGKADGAIAKDPECKQQ